MAVGPRAEKEVKAVTKRQKDLLRDGAMGAIEVIDMGRKMLYNVLFPRDEKPQWCQCAKCGQWHRKADER